MRPLLGSSTPRIMLMVVVLPAPLGPSSPTISPGAIENDRSSTASVPPYALRRFETSRIDIKKKGEVSSTAPGELALRSFRVEAEGRRLLLILVQDFLHRILLLAAKSLDLNNRLGRLLLEDMLTVQRRHP